MSRGVVVRVVQAILPSDDHAKISIQLSESFIRIEPSSPLNINCLKVSLFLGKKKQWSYGGKDLIYHS